MPRHIYYSSHFRVILLKRSSKEVKTEATSSEYVSHLGLKDTPWFSRQKKIAETGFWLLVCHNSVFGAGEAKANTSKYQWILWVTWWGGWAFPNMPVLRHIEAISHTTTAPKVTKRKIFQRTSAFPLPPTQPLRKLVYTVSWTTV
jgi:hypothetical protein